MLESLAKLVTESGFAGFFSNPDGWRNLVMIVIACVLLYLGIKKQYEPLLMVGIAVGCLLANVSSVFMTADGSLPDALYHQSLWDAFLDNTSPYYHSYGHIMAHGGLIDILYIGVKAGIYPCLIFMGIGAMTDFGPLISNPKSLLLGAAAQFGVFFAFFGATLLGFNGNEAASIGIIGGADGPTAILTTRSVKMTQLRDVSKTEKIIFPIVVTIFVVLLLPSTAPLIGCLMFGNLLKETGVTERLSDVAQNALMNIVTLFLGISVGATMVGSRFLTVETIKIVVLGLVAFSFSTVGGLLVGKLMYKLSGGKINPLIGSAGVSAVPMAARVSQKEGQKANPSNFLLMHAMGPNVAGVIGSAIAAGFLIKMFGG